MRGVLKVMVSWILRRNVRIAFKISFICSPPSVLRSCPFALEPLESGESGRGRFLTHLNYNTQCVVCNSKFFRGDGVLTLYHAVGILKEKEVCYYVKYQCGYRTENSEIKQEAENVFSNYGLSLTEAFNIFLQQSLNSNGFPFLLSPENAEYMRSKAAAQLMAEIDKGWKSAEEGGWLTLEDVESRLGLTDE